MVVTAILSSNLERKVDHVAIGVSKMMCGKKIRSKYLAVFRLTLDNPICKLYATLEHLSLA